MENYYNQNEASGHELDWDDEIEQESNFTLLAEGDYHFTVDKVDRGRYQGGGKIPPCNQAIVSMTVTGLNGERAMLTERFFLHSTMEWKLSEFFASIGMKEPGKKARLKWNEVCGKGGTCHVKQREFEKTSGGKSKTNDIDKFYPASAGVPAKKSWSSDKFE